MLDRLKERREQHVLERRELLARVALLEGAIAELNDAIREAETGIAVSDSIALGLQQLWP